MIWTTSKHYQPCPYNLEAEIEAAVADIKLDLFGNSRIYLDVKKLIGQKGKTQNIPDGYLIDLSSTTNPVLYVVEVELAAHDPLRHVAQQLLNFSLSFKSTPQKMKVILRETLEKSPQTLAICEAYAKDNGFNNIDYLLEKLIYSENAFNTLVIIDELEEELESILLSSLGFPVETLTLQRFKSESGEVAYEFEPFLYDLTDQGSESGSENATKPAIDPSQIDTIVVPAKEDGFREVFLGENRWWAIRIHASMIPKLKYIAAYQVAPESAITYLAEIAKIEPWKDTKKYVVTFKEPAQKITPLRLVPGGSVKAPQSIRYTAISRLKEGTSLDDVF